MCPPCAVVRGVRIAILIRVLMMHPVRGHPEDRSALKRHGSASSQEVLKPLRDFVAPMGEQAVVGHAYADVDSEEVSDYSNGEVLPRKEEQCSDRAYMKCRHEDGRDPVNSAVPVLTPEA